MALLSSSYLLGAAPSGAAAKPAALQTGALRLDLKLGTEMFQLEFQHVLITPLVTAAARERPEKGESKCA